MMNYLGQDDMTQTMGIGTLGEIRQGPDGNLYQWVHGVDGLGNPLGFWKKLKKIARAVTKPVADVAQKAVQFVKKPYCIPLQAIPGPIKGITKQVCRVVGHLKPLANIPVVGSYYQGINRFCNVAKGCGIAGLESSLMQAPDGTIYQVQGLADDADLNMGTGYSGLGALFQAPDGTIYQMSNVGDDELQGFEADDELGDLADEDLQGFEADDDLGDLTEEELRGLEADDELQGFEADDELGDLAADDELHGFAADEDLSEFAEDEVGYLADEDLQGCRCNEQNLSEDLDGYIPDNRPQGLSGYVPAGSATQTARKFSQTPEPWKSLW
jgi:hypothetical protein